MSMPAELRMILLQEQEIRTLAKSAAKLRAMLAEINMEGEIDDAVWQGMKDVCNLAITALRGAEDPAVTLALINVPELLRVAKESGARE